MFSLQNKTVLITGGGSGIGSAISILLAKQGASVFILDIDEAGAIDTVNKIQAEHGVAAFKKCNISDQSDVEDAIKYIISEAGEINIVINNAGIAHVGNVETTLASDVDRLLGVNVKGVYHVIQAAIPFMKEKGGVILNMASVASSVGLADRFAYSMTKGAVVGITLSVAKDYIQYNIRCNCISPARVHTPFVDGFIAKNYPGKEAEMFQALSESQPIGRMGQPQEVAFLALYLCSDEASFITGSDYPIDGGFIKLNN